MGKLNAGASCVWSFKSLRLFQGNKYKFTCVVTENWTPHCTFNLFWLVLACFLPIRAYSADHYSLETTSYNIQKPRLPRPDDLRERLSSSERKKCEQNVLNILIPTYDFSQHIGGFSALLFGRRPVKFVYHLRWTVSSLFRQVVSIV